MVITSRPVVAAAAVGAREREIAHKYFNDDYILKTERERERTTTAKETKSNENHSVPIKETGLLSLLRLWPGSGSGLALAWLCH